MPRRQMYARLQVTYYYVHCGSLEQLENLIGDRNTRSKMKSRDAD